MSTSLTKHAAPRDARHLMRYLKSKAGMEPMEIAKAEHVSIGTVIKSIQEIEAYENQNSEGQLQLAVRDLVISTMPQAKATLHGLLTATEMKDVKNLKTGLEERVSVEDKTTRLEGMKLVVSMAGALQPKGPAVAVNVNQTNQTANLGSGETFEERMRRLRAKAQEHNLLPPESAAVPEYVDAGRDAPDEDDEEESE